MTTTFETTDPDLAYRFLTATYGPMRFSTGGGPHLLRVARHQLGPVGLHRMVLRSQVAIDAAPLRTLCFAHLAGGAIGFRTRNRPGARYTRGDVFLAAQPDAPFRAVLHDADLELALLDPALLADVADAAPGRAAHPVRFTGYRPVSACAAALWCNTYRFARQNLTAGPGAAAPLVVSGAARLLAATALAVFPNDAQTEPGPGDGRDAHPVALRRAVTYIDDNAQRDTSPADIAAAAHVSIRALQLAFRRHLDTTPMAYLRRVRLEQAHRDLLTGDPSSTTVHQVAARWGFANHSRFTAHYHAAYGVAPSRTLRHHDGSV